MANKFEGDAHPATRRAPSHAFQAGTAPLSKNISYWLPPALCQLLQMANMLEGGGKTPILPPEELQAMGFKLVAYPLSLLGVSIRAMERALTGLKAGVVPDVRDTGTFVDIQMAVGFPVSAVPMYMTCCLCFYEGCMFLCHWFCRQLVVYAVQTAYIVC
jgi:hypothetical protein